MELAYDLYLPPVEQNLPPVILLHGMFDSRKTWKGIAPAIARKTGRRVYCVDARNHGDSPWSEEMSFDILADDLDTFLTRHGIPRAALAGHSMGGRTALTLALKKADRVEKLVVEDMSLKSFRPVTGGVFMHLSQLLEGALQDIPPDADDTEARRAVAQHFQPLLKQKGGAEMSYDLSTMPLKKGVDGKWAWQANLSAIHRFLTTPRIRQTLAGVYMGDAMFLYGDKSPFKVDRDQTIERFFPRATKLGFEGASHLVHFEFPERFVDTVSAFMNGHHIHSTY